MVRQGQGFQQLGNQRRALAGGQCFRFLFDLGEAHGRTFPSGPGYSFSIDGIDYTNTSGIFTNLPVGGYSVTAKNSDGCISNDRNAFIDPGPPSVPTAIVNLTHPTCLPNTGVITITSPTGAGISYSIDGVSYSNSSGVFSGLTAGNYNVTAKNNSGCISQAANAVLVFTGNTNTSSVTNIDRCADQLPFVWNGTNYNVSGIYTYTTTNNTGCDSVATLNFTVLPQINPSFTVIGSLCQNSVAPNLSSTSNNGINGTWSPAIINTATAGTTLYTFTPTAGQCAVPASMSITVNAPTLPAFNQIGPLCQNSVAPTLPLVSTNGINGSWNPAIINTATAGTILYTFTPDAGQCAVTTSMNITVNAPTITAFNQIGPLCQNNVAPTLPSTSTNAINGTWSPATINTATAGTTLYTFTPTAGQCAVASSMSITVNAPTTPAFNQIGPLCQNNTAPTLPLISTNGINGTWSPSTINTATAGTTLYTFTPTAGQCALSASMSITVDPQITASFTQIGPLCQSSNAPALPLTSINNINGTWSPATINTSATGTTLYTFTPTAGICAITVTMNITVNAVTNSSTNTTVCSNDLPYLWNNNSYNLAGTNLCRIIDYNFG